MYSLYFTTLQRSVRKKTSYKAPSFHTPGTPRNVPYTFFDSAISFRLVDIGNFCSDISWYIVVQFTNFPEGKHWIFTTRLHLPWSCDQVNATLWFTKTTSYRAIHQFSRFGWGSVFGLYRQSDSKHWPCPYLWRLTWDNGIDIAAGHMQARGATHVLRVSYWQALFAQKKNMAICGNMCKTKSKRIL